MISIEVFTKLCNTITTLSEIIKEQQYLLEQSDVSEEQLQTVRTKSNIAINNLDKIV